jgi:hypothetical protein
MYMIRHQTPTKDSKIELGGAYLQIIEVSGKVILMQEDCLLVIAAMCNVMR